MDPYVNSPDDHFCGNRIRLQQHQSLSGTLMPAWAKDYEYNKCSNEFVHKNALHKEKEMVANWFKL